MRTTCGRGESREDSRTATAPGGSRTRGTRCAPLTGAPSGVGTMALTRNPSSAATVKPYGTMLVSIVIDGSTPVQVDVVAENTAGCPQSQEKPVSVLARPESGSVCQVDVAGSKDSVWSASVVGCRRSLLQPATISSCPDHAATGADIATGADGRVDHVSVSVSNAHA